MKKVIFLFILVSMAVLISAQTQVEWQTSMGNFRAELREDLVPGIAGNFIDLANDGFYNNLIFHRVISGFMIQDGCPLGTGYGGPGYTIPDEFDPSLVHDVPGVLAMANSGPNTNGSQYYITVAPTSWLDGGYSIFGQIIEGMDVVFAISEVATGDGDKPIVDVDIYSVTVIDITVNYLQPETPEFTIPQGTTQAFMALIYAINHNLTMSWFVNDILMSESEFNFDFSYTFAEAGDYEVRINSDNGDHAIDKIWTVHVEPANSNEDVVNLNTITLNQNRPNPFMTETTIGYSLTKKADIDLKIFNLRGQLVRTFSNLKASVGDHQILWDGNNESGTQVSSGVYYYVMQNGHETIVKKAVLLR